VPLLLPFSRGQTAQASKGKVWDLPLSGIEPSPLIAIPALLFIGGYRGERNGKFPVFYHHVAGNLGDQSEGHFAVAFPANSFSGQTCNELDALKHYLFL